MISIVRANAARDVIGGKLRRLLGPKLVGLNAFGVSFDQRASDLFIRVDLDPEVYERIRSEIPQRIDDVPIIVESAHAAEFD